MRGIMCRQDAPVPPALAELARRLRAAGGDVDVSLSDRDRWELCVDFRQGAPDNALQSLQNARGVTAIRLLRGGVTDRGIAYLRNLPDLTVLVIRSKDVTDIGMQSVGAMKRLAKLDIQEARLTEKGLRAIAGLNHLNELYLYGVRLGDRDVAPLAQMVGLGWLYLPATVSRARQEALQRALPATRVVRDVDPERRQSAGFVEEAPPIFGGR